MSTKNTTISLDEWVATIEKLESAGKSKGTNAKGVSITELADMTGMGPRQAHRYMKTLIDRGDAEWVGRELRPAMDGICRPVPVYRLTAKKESPKKKKR